jgi:hypothetical protein
MQFILLRARTSDLNHLHGDAAATPDQRRENEAVTVEALLSGAQGLSHDSYTNIFRRVFERVVEACIAAGLVGGEGFAVDASLIVADADKQRSIPGSEWQKTGDPETASRAVKEYLATLDDAAFGAASEVTPKFVSPSARYQ